MSVTFGSRITIDGSLNAAVAAAPNLPAKYKRQLPVPWSPERYENAIVSLLQRLQGSRVGGAVLSQMTRPLTIRPFIWTPANALAMPLTRLHATEFDRSTHCSAGQPEVHGTGHGTTVTIWITPANRRVPDATLLHEMVHALRMMRGVLTCLSYGADFDREEEYFAILITNIFQSELGRTLMRLNHDSDNWQVVSSPWEEFRIDPFLLTAFGIQHSDLATEIGRAKKATFNPFNPAYADRVEAR